MPNWKTHSKIGFLSSILAIMVTHYYLELKITSLDSINILLFGIVGSLAPDLDTETSKLSRSVRGLFLLILTVTITSGFLGEPLKETGMFLTIFGFLCSIPLFFKHRGLWHNFLGILSPVVVLVKKGRTISAVGYLFGYVSHLIADEVIH